MAPLKVAVIGGGPSGMFLCHAIEKRLQQQAPKDIQVTCFERSSGPGGVWRTTSDDNTPSMYAALWTNGPSQVIEFADYTFDEHFQKPVPVYLPRKDVLEYMHHRMLKNCPDFYNKYFQFNKEVTNVVFHDDTHAFNITVRDVETQERIQDTFHKCIWACGDNGKKQIPKSLKQRCEAFTGRMIHSTETANLSQDVKDKSILLIGGSYSAEDLALQTIKLGAKKVFISTRDSESPVTWTKNWPYDKVEMLVKRQVLRAYDNTVEFEKVEWTWPHGYEAEEDDEVSDKIEAIDTIIFCTGYLSNLDMLEPRLRTHLPGEHQSSFRFPLTVPSDWEMAPHPVNKLTGKIKPGKTLYYPGMCVPTLYRGILIDNPNMMFMSPYDMDTPLLALDVYAWLLSGFLTGVKEMPSAEEMKRRNTEQALKELSMPYLRYYMDSNYCETLDEIPEFWGGDSEEDESSSSSEEEEGATTYSACADEYYAYIYDFLYEVIKESEFPLEKKTLEILRNFDDKSFYHRYNANREKENQWQTFRDYDDAGDFYSVFTGTKAAPLGARWLDLE